jgi:SUMO ligase MMS21 Smc5/6 complex component
VQEAYQEQTKEVDDSIMQLQKCVHQIEEMQKELEERSSSTTTGVGPVVKIRTAMADLKADMKKMDVRLGITRHQLLHLQLQNHAQTGG